MPTARSTDSSGRTNVAVPATLQCELFEQRRVDVGADAESEEPTLTAQIGRALDDRVGTRLTDRRRAIRPEEHERKPAVGRVGRHGRFERALDVGAAVRAKRIEIAEGIAHVAAGGDRPSVAERTHVAREIDKTKTVRRRQRLQQLASRGARACSIFRPDIEPDTSITNTMSRGVARAACAGGDSVISAKPSSPFGALAMSEIAAEERERTGTSTVTGPRASSMRAMRRFCSCSACSAMRRRVRRAERAVVGIRHGE